MAVLSVGLASRTRGAETEGDGSQNPPECQVFFAAGERPGAYLERLEQSSRFIEESERLPSALAPDAAEKSLGRWMASYQRRNPDIWYQGLSERAIAILGDKGLLSRQRMTAEMRLAQLDMFIIENDRLPSATAFNAVESGLALWRDNRKRLNPDTWYQGLSERSIAILRDRGLLGRQTKTSEKRIADLNGFISSNKNLPSANAKDDAEKSLGKWLANYKRLNSPTWYQGLSEPAIAILRDQGLLGRQRQASETRVGQLDRFIVESDRLPSAIAASELEKSLGGWAASYKYRNPDTWFLGLSERAIAILRDRGLLSRLAKTRAERIAELDDFIAENERLPSTIAADDAEKSLGVWAASYKYRNPDSWGQKLSERAIAVLRDKGLLIAQ
jgi:hypothetical protein